MTLAEAFAPLVDLVYPPRCPACGEGIAAQAGSPGMTSSAQHAGQSPSCAAIPSPQAGPRGG